jgi:hypothetical protein
LLILNGVCSCSAVFIAKHWLLAGCCGQASERLDQAGLTSRMMRSHQRRVEY